MSAVNNINATFGLDPAAGNYNLLFESLGDVKWDKTGGTNVLFQGKNIYVKKEDLTGAGTSAFGKMDIQDDLGNYHPHGLINLEYYGDKKNTLVQISNSVRNSIIVLQNAAQFCKPTSSIGRLCYALALIARGSRGMWRDSRVNRIINNILDWRVPGMPGPYHTGGNQTLRSILADLGWQIVSTMIMTLVSAAYARFHGRFKGGFTTKRGGIWWKRKLNYAVQSAIKRQIRKSSYG